MHPFSTVRQSNKLPPIKWSVLLSVLVFFLVPILISSSSVQAETRFMVVDLGPSRVPLDINNSGQVCGAWLFRIAIGFGCHISPG